MKTDLKSFIRQQPRKSSIIYKYMTGFFIMSYLCIMSTFTFQLDEIDQSNNISDVLLSTSTNLVTNLKEKQELKRLSKEKEKAEARANARERNNRSRKIDILPNNVTLRSLGIVENVSPNQFDTLRNNTRITIIISHCEENLEWIRDYIGFGKYNIEEILIYSKCGNEVGGLDDIVELAPTKTIVAPNVGRCDHSYASWIQENYKILEQEFDTNIGQDIVLFIKDNDYHLEKFYTFQELFTFASIEGFGCAEKPTCDCDNDQCNKKKDIALLYHDPEKLDAFKMNTHNRLDRDKKQPFKSDKFKKLKDWRVAMDFKIPKSKTIPVCYGGVFAAKKRHILNQPKEVWDRVVESLSRGDNIIEGHFAERLWAVILSNNNEDYTKKVSDAVLPFVNDTFWCWNRKGMLMVPRSEGYNASKFTDFSAMQ